MRSVLNRLLSVFCMLALALGIMGCQTPTSAASSAQGPATSTESTSSQDSSKSSSAKTPTDSQTNAQAVSVTEGNSYTSKDEVAAYLHEFGHLPPNFISKTKARKAGWDARAGNLQEVCPGMSIGGSVFYNDDGLLPEANERTWHECDINYHGGHRGAERIVWSSDGLIYYTADHYKTFEQLY